MIVSYFVLGIVSAGAAPAPIKISSGSEHNCVLFDNQKIKCWGANGYGQLGLGSTANSIGGRVGDMGGALPYVDLGSDVRVRDVQSGFRFNCVFADQGPLKGIVKCWGESSGGVLGYENTARKGNSPLDMGENLAPVNFGTEGQVIELTVGVYQSCVIFEDRRVKCWGYNDYGQLGYGNLQNRGSGPGEMGDRLPFLDLGSNETVAKIQAGYEHTCALFESGRVKCWGRNQFGQLGLGVSDNRGDQPGEMGDSLPFVDLGQSLFAKDLIVMHNSTCALLNNDQLKCWGANMYGQLGQGHSEPRGSMANQMGDALAATDLGFAQKISRLASFGTATVCSLFFNATIKCWGWNRSGGLGLGDTDNRGDGASEMGENLPFVYLGNSASARDVSVGAEHTCAIVKQKNRPQGVKCWGVNSLGQLGLEDSRRRGDEPGTMGDELPYVNLGTN